MYTGIHRGASSLREAMIGGAVLLFLRSATSDSHTPVARESGVTARGRPRPRARHPSPAGRPPRPPAGAPAAA
jgi:hypothetical protein